MLKEAKKALRVTTDYYDSEIASLLMAGANDLTIAGEEEEIRNPKPEELASLVGRKYLNILAGEHCLISADHTDIYMTLYNPDARMLELAEKLASAEGLFVRKGADDNPRR